LWRVPLRSRRRVAPMSLLGHRVTFHVNFGPTETPKSVENAKNSHPKARKFARLRFYDRWRPSKALAGVECHKKMSLLEKGQTAGQCERPAASNNDRFSQRPPHRHELPGVHQRVDGDQHKDVADGRE